MNYPDVCSRPAIAHETSVAFTSFFGIAVTPKNNRSAGNKKRLHCKHPIRARVPSPIQGSPHKPHGSGEKYHRGHRTVNIVIRVKVRFVFVHKERIKGIFLVRATWIVSGTKIRAVNAGKRPTSGHILRKGQRRT